MSHMEINCIALDLDGTLLNSSNCIDTRERECISRLLKNNLKVVLSTGRHFEEIEEFINLLNLSHDQYVVCCDGQYIFDCFGNLLWENEFISSEDIIHVLGILGNERICVFDNSDTYIIVNDCFDYLLYSLKYWVLKILKRKSNIYIVYKKIANLKKMEKIKVFLDIENEKLSELKKYYTVHKCDNGYEILNKKVNKFLALQKLEDISSVDLNETVYFGNFYNDIECFENMEFCVAMKNSPKEITNLAWMVTDSNDDNGVVKALYSIFGDCIFTM